MPQCATRSILPLLLFFLLFRSIPSLCAVPDSKGTDFWFTFPPNYHGSAGNVNADSLFVFIAASTPTKGIITVRDINGQSTDVPFIITDITKVFTYRTRWQNYELVGYNRSGTFITTHQSAQIAMQSFHVTAEEEITVYALNEAVTTSDAMMVLPTDVLGKEYFVMSYSSDGSANGTTLSTQSTPSECAVVATEDNTRVTIIPTVAIKGTSAMPITISLNKGDSYLLQADIELGNLRPDLTGTSVSGDKPIAVFGGHQRSLLPAAYKDSLKSRDYLLEQMLPLSVWGKNYLLTPFPLPASVPKRGYDLYRVLAAYDNTEVLIDNVKRATLKSGEFYEAPLLKAAVLTATKPVLAAQYKRSTQIGSTSYLSDPFMLILPPRKQFLTSYLCINAQAYESTRVYSEQYITIISPTAYISTVKVDGKPVDMPLFTEIPNSCYSYAWVKVGDGAHRIDAEKETGIYVYGYGSANSYGYVGGMAFTTEEEPVITATGDTTLCAGNSAQLHASGGVTYKWTPTNNISCTDCDAPIVHPQENTHYQVEITDNIGCVSTRSVEVRVNQLPEPTINKSAPLCAGESVQLFAKGGTSFHWSPSTGLSCTDCSSPTVKPSSTSTYTVIASNDFGCTASTTVTIIVHALPSIVVRPDTTICSQDSTLLMATGGDFYQWSPATGLSCTTCPTPVARPKISTTYHVRVSTKEGCAREDSVRVTLQACVVQANLSALIFDNLLLCSSMEDSCTLRNTGDLPLTVLSWKKTGQDTAAFIITPPALSFPYLLKQNDSLLFHVRFQPSKDGLQSAALSVLTSVDTLMLSSSCAGWGHHRTINFSMSPDTLVAPGDTVFLRIYAACDYWKEIQVDSLTCEITHRGGWMKYAGLISRGDALDPSWHFSVHEHPASGDEVVTVLEISGTQPVATDGLLAVIPMKTFITDDASYTPSLRVTANGREACVLTEASGNKIMLHNCGGTARSVHYRDGYYSFTLRTDDRQASFQYSTAFPGITRLEIFNQLGEAVRVAQEERPIGHYETSFDLSGLPRGLYIARMVSGIFSQSIPFVVDGE